MSTFILFSPANAELIVQSEVRPPATKPPEGVPSPRKIRAPPPTGPDLTARTWRPTEAFHRGGHAELTKPFPPSPLGAPSSRVFRSQRPLKLPAVTSLAQVTKLPAGPPGEEPFAKRTYSAWAVKEFSQGNAVVMRAGAEMGGSLEAEYAARLHRLAEVQQRAELRQTELQRERRRAKTWQKRQEQLRKEEQRRLAAEREAIALEQERLAQQEPSPDQVSAEEAEEKRRLRIEKNRLKALKDMRKCIKGRVSIVVPAPTVRRRNSFSRRTSPDSPTLLFSRAGSRTEAAGGGSDSDELESIDEGESSAVEQEPESFVANKFENCVRLANKYGKPLTFVKRCLEDFSHFDEDGSGSISREEFGNVVARMLDLPSEQNAPEHFTRLIKILQNERGGQMNADDDFEVTFEEYLLWYISSTFTEELSGTSEQEKAMRQLARDTGIPLQDIERVKKTFDKFDTDKSGAIDKDEFVAVLCTVLKVKNPEDLSQSMLTRYWREADTNNTGSVNFEEFLLWYFTMMM